MHTLFSICVFIFMSFILCLFPKFIFVLFLSQCLSLTFPFSFSLFIYLFLYLFSPVTYFYDSYLFFLSVCLFVCLSVCLFVWLSVCLSAARFFFLCLKLSCLGVSYVRLVGWGSRHEEGFFSLLIQLEIWKSPL